MPFLNKIINSEIVTKKLTYLSHKKKVRSILTEEQFGFCAYSEMILKNSTVSHIEHFDPDLKGTIFDGYYNWYVVAPIMNTNKPQNIKYFKPYLSPHDPDLNNRLIYRNRQYIAANDKDTSTKNLINFLNLNKKEVYDDVTVHLNLLRIFKSLDAYQNNLDFVKLLISHKPYLEFYSAVTEEFEIDVLYLIKNLDSLRKNYNITPTDV